MRARHVVALVVVLVATAAALGCGQSEEAASFESYISDLQAPMERFSDEALPLAQQMNELPEDATAEDVAAMTEDMGAMFAALSSGLRSVEPYPDMAAEHEGLASAAGEMSESFQEMADLLRHMFKGKHDQAELEAHAQELEELAGSFDALDPPFDAYDNAIQRISEDLSVEEPAWWSELIERWEEVGM